MEKYRSFLENCSKHTSGFLGKYREERSRKANILVNDLGEIVIPEDDILGTMDPKDLQETYHR